MHSDYILNSHRGIDRNNISVILNSFQDLKNNRFRNEFGMTKTNATLNKQSVMLNLFQHLTNKQIEQKCSNKTINVNFIQPQILKLSWIIRGVDGVTSDRHLAGSRPTENPLSPKGRGNNVSPVHFSKGRRVDFSLPTRDLTSPAGEVAVVCCDNNNTNAGEVTILLPQTGKWAPAQRGDNLSTKCSLIPTFSIWRRSNILRDHVITWSLDHCNESRCA